MTRSNRPSVAAAARQPRARGLHARARKTGTLMECASVRFASRWSGETSIRSHQCVAFNKCCAMMRSSRPSAA
eukprot:11164478-Lingulodinium_polyedra.AAC.1